MRMHNMRAWIRAERTVSGRRAGALTTHARPGKRKRKRKRKHKHTSKYKHKHKHKRALASDEGRAYADYVQCHVSVGVAISAVELECTVSSVVYVLVV